MSHHTCRCSEQELVDGSSDIPLELEFELTGDAASESELENENPSVAIDSFPFLKALQHTEKEDARIWFNLFRAILRNNSTGILSSTFSAFKRVLQAWAEANQADEAMGMIEGAAYAIVAGANNIDPPPAPPPSYNTAGKRGWIRAAGDVRQWTRHSANAPELVRLRGRDKERSVNIVFGVLGSQVYPYGPAAAIIRGRTGTLRWRDSASSEMEEEFQISGLEGDLEDETYSEFENSAVVDAAAAAVKAELVRGVRDEARLTDAGFNARHPERAGRPVQPGEAGATALGQEWIVIRDSLVRPAIMTELLGVPVSACTMPTGSFIAIRSGVLCTSAIQDVLLKLEPYFRKAGLRVTVTSGVRDAQGQLNIIVSKAKQYGLDKKYPSVLRATLSDVETWRGAWDELLHVKRFIVNPPVTVRSDRAGKDYQPSPHIRGGAFDLSGADLAAIQAVVTAFKKAGGAIGQIKFEPENNAVHVGLA